MLQSEATLTREELLEFYQGKVAKWQIPDDVLFVDAIPQDATGKILKMKLREMLKDYVLPTARRDFRHEKTGARLRRPI